MAPSVCTWYEAGIRLGEIRESCEAFVRGDQPEKIDHLTVDEIKELFETARAIVEFCVTSMERRTAPLKFRDYNTYTYARTYARNLAHVLQRHKNTDPRDLWAYEEWLESEPDRPNIQVQYA